jgi:vacuolar protein sorting-associated protein 26
MASLFGFGSTPVEVEIHLQGEESRRHVELKHPSTSSTTSSSSAVTAGEKGEKGKGEMCPVYYDAESVQGTVAVRVKDGKKLVHEGIRLELVGAIGASLLSSSSSLLLSASS